MNKYSLLFLHFLLFFMILLISWPTVAAADVVAGVFTNVFTDVFIFVFSDVFDTAGVFVFVLNYCSLFLF